VSTVVAGGAIVAGGEGRWWGSGYCGYVDLGDVSAGATFVIWGSVGWVTSTGGYALENAGGYASRLIITEDAPGVMVHADSCSYGGILVHEVLSTFEVTQCGGPNT
jgi:hypothetical protein